MNRNFQRIIRRISGTSRSLNNMALQLVSIARQLHRRKDLKVKVMMDGETATVVDINNRKTGRKFSIHMEATVKGLKTTLYRAERGKDIKSVTTSMRYSEDLLLRELKLIHM